MKKRILSLVAVLFIASSVSVFAKTGIGVQGGYTIGGMSGAAVTFKVDALPCVFAVDLGFGSDYFAVGGTADWWIANPTITGTWKFYYGVGLAASVGLGDPLGLSVGARALLGTNIFLLDNFLELYLQLAAQPTLNILPDVGFAMRVPVNAGLRVWF